MSAPTDRERRPPSPPVERAIRILIVTPMHDEADNVLGVHSTLQQQTFAAFDWVVVDDGSTDRTRSLLESIDSRPIPSIVQRHNDGGLIAGSAYGAWRAGVSDRLEQAGIGRYTHVMKLDADVRLSSTYFERVLARMGTGVGLAGGVIATAGMHEQVHHVPGPVKLYTAAAYGELTTMPSAIGFDVMDEVALQAHGDRTVVVPDAPFELARAIGASEGRTHGRFRNGRMCRWTGYHPAYFVLHVLRYIGRRPYVIGSMAMVIGYLRAGSGPYPKALKHAHASFQRRKLLEMRADPVGWLKATYRY